MAETGFVGEVQVLEGEVIPGDPSPRRVHKRIRLSTIRDVRRELSAVYIDCRRGLMPASTGAKLVFMLDRLRQSIADDEFDQRLKVIEKRTKVRA